MTRQPPQAVITPETIEHAFECCGAVQCVTDAGIRLLASSEELDGERPRGWIGRHRAAFGLRAPWEIHTLGLERAG